MRIIAGQFKSRRVKPVPGIAVRPTPDRLRETLFSVLGARVEDTVFLDAYAGSGAVGLEALSRGAKRVILIERSPQAIGVIRENVHSLGAERQVTTIRGNAAAQIRDLPCDIAFVDPPYERTAEYALALEALAANNCALVIAQHPSRLTLSERYGALQRTRILKQGDNSLSFYSRVEIKEPRQSAGQNETEVHDVGSGGTGAHEIPE